MSSNDANIGGFEQGRFKRSVPVVERSFLQKHETEKQMCALPCQRQPGIGYFVNSTCFGQ